MQLSAMAVGAPLAIASFTAITLEHCVACLGVASGLVAVGTSGDACPGAVQLWANSTGGWSLTATVTDHNATLVGCDFGRVVHLAGSSVLAVGIPDADGGVGLVEVYDVADPRAPQHVESVLWQRHIGVTHLGFQSLAFSKQAPTSLCTLRPPLGVRGFGESLSSRAQGSKARFHGLGVGGQTS